MYRFNKDKSLTIVASEQKKRKGKASATNGWSIVQRNCHSSSVRGIALKPFPLHPVFVPTVSKLGRGLKLSLFILLDLCWFDCRDALRPSEPLVHDLEEPTCCELILEFSVELPLLPEGPEAARCSDNGARPQPSAAYPCKCLVDWGMGGGAWVTFGGAPRLVDRVVRPFAGEVLRVGICELPSTNRCRLFVPRLCAMDEPGRTAGVTVPAGG